MRRFAVYSLLLVMLCVICSCADDTKVGSGLLGSEDLEVLFTDDFDIILTQHPPTPFNLSLAQFYSLGTLDNPSFGEFTSSFYVRPTLSSFSIVPNFVGGTFDSVVLALKVDTTRFFGRSDAFYDIDVLSLNESIDDIDTFRSDQVFMTNPVPVGTRSRIVPSKLDSILTYDQLGDTVYFSDVITIPLDRRFGASIFVDTLNNDNLVGFSTLLDGFLVQATSTNSILQVNLADEVSSLLFYYKDSSGVNQSFPYRFSGDAPLNFSYDISGSNLEETINNPTSELFYIQGHAGAILEIDIDDVNKLSDPFINHASIEVYAQNEGIIDTSIFGLPLALDLLRTNEAGDLVSVIDLAVGQEQGQTRGIFDGDIEVDETKQIVKYEMNITTHLKEILEGRQSSKMFIAVRNRTQTPNNLIIYGPNHPIYPVRLKLTHTKS